MKTIGRFRAYNIKNYKPEKRQNIMGNIGSYAASSMEVHLFFLRIMKEHSLFLEAGFPCKEEEWIQKADWFRREFEQLLWDVVKISDGRVDRSILESHELVTGF